MTLMGLHLELITTCYRYVLSKSVALYIFCSFLLLCFVIPCLTAFDRVNSLYFFKKKSQGMIFCRIGPFIY